MAWIMRRLALWGTNQSMAPRGIPLFCSKAPMPSGMFLITYSYRNLPSCWNVRSLRSEWPLTVADRLPQATLWACRPSEVKYEAQKLPWPSVRSRSVATAASPNSTQVLRSE